MENYSSEHDKERNRTDCYVEIPISFGLEVVDKLNIESQNKPHF